MTQTKSPPANTGRFNAPFPVLPAAVSPRVIFAESAGRGLWVGEVAPAGEAAREIAALGAAITATETRAAA